jgi:ABC-type sugar transport system substrate-binding protein
MLNSFTKLKQSRWARILSACLLISTTSISVQAEPIRVGFLCQAPEGDPFWELVVEAMEAAAADLNIDLEVKYIQIRETYTFKRLGSHFLKQEPKLDYLITKYVRLVTAEHIQEAQKFGTEVFVINSDVPEPEQTVVGSLPREKYPNWIGHFVPDDRQAGYDQAQMLIKSYKQAAGSEKDKVIHILGLEAIDDSTVGENRKAGLNDYVKSNTDVVLEGIKRIGDANSSTKTEVAKVLIPHPDIEAVWTSQEELAWGAVQYFEAADKRPGKDVYIGGFDWGDNSARAIADGRITASMAGHFMEGAWALVLLYDYHNGIDFDRDPGVRMNTPLSVINADNFKHYVALTQQGGLDEIDFRKFSKKYNPDLKTYNFNINQFFDK